MKTGSCYICDCTSVRNRENMVLNEGGYFNYSGKWVFLSGILYIPSVSDEINNNTFKSVFPKMY